MAHSTLDFLAHLGSPTTSDVIVRFVVANQGGCGDASSRENSSAVSAARLEAEPPAPLLANGGTKQQLRTLHAHRILLVEGIPSLFGVGLPGSGATVDVVLQSENEVEAAELVLSTCYCPADATTPMRGHEQTLLVQVLQVAERLGAQRCVAATIQVLGAVGPLEWATAKAVYKLPQTYRDDPDSSALLAASATALHSHLGDLYLTWRDASKRCELLALPFAAFLQLLSDARTGADSENTVIFTLAAWLEKHPTCSREERSMLGACVRLPLVSRMYMTIAARLLPALVPSIVAADAVSAITYVEASREERDRLAPAKLKAAWRLPERPSGTEAYAAVLQWSVPLTDLRRIFDEAMAVGDGIKAAVMAPDSVVFGGIKWCLRFEAVQTSGGVLCGVFLQAMPPPGYKHSSGAALSVVARFELPTTNIEGTFAFSPKSFGTPVGIMDAFGLGPRTTWDDAALRALAVDAGGRVPCRATIFRV